MTNQNKQFYKECFKELIKQGKFKDAFMISSRAGYSVYEKDQYIIIELTKRKHLLSPNYDYLKKNNKIIIIVNKKHPTLNLKSLKIMHRRHQYTKLNNNFKYKIQVLELKKNNNEKLVVYLANIFNFNKETNKVEFYNHRLKEIANYNDDYKLIQLLNQDFLMKSVYNKEVKFNSNDDFYEFIKKEYRLIENSLIEKDINYIKNDKKAEYQEQINYHNKEIDRFKNKIYKLDLIDVKIACQNVKEFDPEFEYTIEKVKDDNMIWIYVKCDNKIYDKLINDDKYNEQFYYKFYKYLDERNVRNYLLDYEE